MKQGKKMTQHLYKRMPSPQKRKAPNEEAGHEHKHHKLELSHPKLNPAYKDGMLLKADIRKLISFLNKKRLANLEKYIIKRPGKPL